MRVGINGKQQVSSVSMKMIADREESEIQSDKISFNMSPFVAPTHRDFGLGRPYIQLFSC